MLVLPCIVGRGTKDPDPPAFALHFTRGDLPAAGGGPPRGVALRYALHLVRRPVNNLIRRLNMNKKNFTVRIREDDRKFLELCYEKDKQKNKQGGPGYGYHWAFTNRSFGSYLVQLAISQGKVRFPPEPPPALEVEHTPRPKPGRPGKSRSRRRGHAPRKLGRREKVVR